MDSEPSYIERVLQYAQRDQLLLQCPALVLLVYQYVVACFMRRECVVDPLVNTAQADALSRWLCARNVKTFLGFIFAPTTCNFHLADEGDASDADHDTQHREQQLRLIFQRVLTSMCFPVCRSADDPQQHEQQKYREHAQPNVHPGEHGDATLLCTISGQVRFVGRASVNKDNAREANSTVVAQQYPTRVSVPFPPTRTATHLTPCAHNPWSAAESSLLSCSRPLQTSTLMMALMNSCAYLRTVTSCALDGSLQSLKSRRFQALGFILQAAGLVHEDASSPRHATAGGAVGKNSTITTVGLNFCMLAVPQQWWILLNCALDRVLALLRSSSHVNTSPQNSTSQSIHNDNINVNKDDNNTGTIDGLLTTSRPVLWQMLAVLATLECERFMYTFPERHDDLVAHTLLVRLIEIGLVYPVKASGCKYFVLSPHFRHALLWQAAAPLCLSAMLEEDDTLSSTQLGAGNTATSSDSQRRLQREDTDTIITETNFRLYAYTSNKGLLNILDQFAEREEEVRGGVVCYRVTRQSFVTAVRKGITAHQMLKFLSLHAHPNMRSLYSDLNRSALGDGKGDHSDPTAKEDVVRRVIGTTDAGAATSARPEFMGQFMMLPQSFCDQLLMWESECNRVVFRKNLVLLRNANAEQQQLVMDYLSRKGEADAVVHAEPGILVLREDVYKQWIAPLLR